MLCRDRSQTSLCVLIVKMNIVVKNIVPFFVALLKN
jgi:hypothetical protein